MGRLLDAGFEIGRQEPPECHLGLTWEVKPSENDLKRLIELFDEPVPNPHPL